jgi:hypothetical protein
MKEIFKDIEGYEGLYQVSNLGNVKALGNGGSNNSKEKILKLTKDKDGYLNITLHKQGKVKTYKIHRLVAMAFIENPNNLEQINHRDEDKANNHVTNLEWCTPKQNINYGTHNQRMAESKSKPVICLETGKIYTSTMDVQRQLGFDNSNISKCCRGKLKQAYSYTWQYVS